MSTTLVVLGAVALAYLVLLEPPLGARHYRDFLADPDRPDARRRLYRRILHFELAYVVAALVATVAGGVSLRRLVVPPARVDIPGPLVAGLVAGVAAASVGLVVAVRRGQVPAIGDIAALLPQTAEERRRFVLVSLAAGVGEELLWRGFLLLYLARRAPSWPIGWAVAVSAAVFGLGHLYQGLRGAVGTAALGAVLAILYLATGSLGWCIALHAAVDLRALVLRPRAAP